MPPELLPKQNQNASDPAKRVDLLLLSNAKKMGLSFNELNLFRLRDFVEFTSIYSGEAGSGSRKATQADIDRMLM